MEIVRCERGHFYDATVDSTCPKCAKMDAGANNLDVEFYPAMATQPVGGIEPAGVTTPVMEDMLKTEAFVTNSGVTNVTVPVGGPAVQEIPSTLPIGFVPTAEVTPDALQSAKHNPPVGWLVCIEGNDKGSDFRIHSQNNFVGRSKSMDICIPGDEYISKEMAAVVSYDDVDRTFYFSPSTGHNIIRANGRPVFSAVVLNAYDELTIGKTKLLFIPLCGERFDWNGK